MDLSDDYEGSEDPSHSYGGGGDYSMEESSQSVDDISSDARSFSNYSELNTDQFSEENASFEHDVSDESNSGTESSDLHNEDHEEGSFPMPGSFFPGRRTANLPGQSGSNNSQRNALSDFLPELLNMINGRHGGGDNVGNIFGNISSGSQRLRKLVDNVIHAEDDSYLAMESLKEISESLLMRNQMFIGRVLPIEELIDGILGVLSSHRLEEEMELQVQACRSLYNLFEVDPDCMAVAIEKGTIKILKNKLVMINYIDLAEQVLETIEFISRFYGKDVLSAGDLSYYIQYFDFFTIHARRKAVAIVANSCADVGPEDFDTIKDVFGSLKVIFEHVTDQSVLGGVLSSFYGVCGGFQDEERLEQLFTVDVPVRLLQSLSTPETSTDDKIKCLDILTVLVSTSSKLSYAIITAADIPDTLVKCFQTYAKSSAKSLQDSLMFLPRTLLTGIARFVASLFPVEIGPILSSEVCRRSTPTPEEIKLLQPLICRIIPLLIAIYMNTVEFNVRRYSLVAFIRAVSYLEVDSLGSITDELVGLCGSALAQNKATLESGTTFYLESGILILGVLSLVATLVTRFEDDISSVLGKEGIIDLVRSLRDYLQDSEAGKHIQFIDDTKIDEMPDDDVTERRDTARSRGNNSLFREELDVSTYSKPKKIKFRMFRSFSSSDIVLSICSECDTILAKVEGAYKSEDVGGLNDVRERIQRLKEMSLDLNSHDDQYNLWSTVKACIFDDGSTLSGYELVSTGLASQIAAYLRSVQDISNLSKDIIIQVFGDKLAELVSILHSALTRIESFSIVDCGLSGEEIGIRSLTKQIKLHLIYDGSCEEDGVPDMMQDLTVSIHCISSFKVLTEFLKHRVVKSTFLTTLFPGLLSLRNGSNTTRNVNDMENMEFEFMIGDTKIQLNDTIFGSIFRYHEAEGKNPKDIWEKTQTIKFRRVPKVEAIEELDGSDDTPVLSAEDLGEQARPDIQLEDMDSDIEPDYSALVALYPHGISTETEDSLTSDVLFLLKFVWRVMGPSDIFINAKLSAKLSRQLDEPLVLAGSALPAWVWELTRNYPFLFPFETRLLFLHSTAFGLTRLIKFMISRVEDERTLSSEDQLYQLGQLSKITIQLERENMLQDAISILDKYGSSKAVLRFQFINEVGTGSGPTLEFYAHVSREFSMRRLDMWRDDSYAPDDTSVSGEDQEIDKYVTKQLFPRPLHANDEPERDVLGLFKSLGMFIARSMLDFRIVDFNFSPLFFELLHLTCRNESLPDYRSDPEKALEAVGKIDEQFYRSLKYIYDNKDNNDELEKLCLTFVLPKYNIPLVDSGESIALSAKNVDTYLELVISETLGRGIEEQLRAFIEGFSRVFSYENLLILSPDELVNFFGRGEEDWSLETLYRTVNVDHGYTMESPTIHDLLSIMSGFTTQERRLFSQFLTGSPKLPIGGFKRLHPPFTVVLKHPEDGVSPDKYLPSVMTCANYFKLPKYSSKEVMRSRILQAIQEGGGAFLLS